MLTPRLTWTFRRSTPVLGRGMRSASRAEGVRRIEDSDQAGQMRAPRTWKARRGKASWWLQERIPARPARRTRPDQNSERASESERLSVNQPPSTVPPLLVNVALINHSRTHTHAHFHPLPDPATASQSRPTSCALVPSPTDGQQHDAVCGVPVPRPAISGIRQPIRRARGGIR